MTDKTESQALTLEAFDRMVSSAQSWGYALVPIDAYQNLIRDSEQLNALEIAGVDNWDWYDEALEEFRQKWYSDD